MANTIKSPPGSFPGWELGSLEQIQASQFMRDEHDGTGKLILRLALAFNDIKGIVLLNTYLSAFQKPDPGEVTAHAGQWAGILTQVNRFPEPR